MHRKTALPILYLQHRKLKGVKWPIHFYETINPLKTNSTWNNLETCPIPLCRVFPTPPSLIFKCLTQSMKKQRKELLTPFKKTGTMQKESYGRVYNPLKRGASKSQLLGNRERSWLKQRSREKDSNCLYPGSNRGWPGTPRSYSSHLEEQKGIILYSRAVSPRS